MAMGLTHQRPNGYTSGRINYAHQLGVGANQQWGSQSPFPFVDNSEHVAAQAQRYLRKQQAGAFANPLITRPEITTAKDDDVRVPDVFVRGAAGIWQPRRFVAPIASVLAVLMLIGCIFDPAGFEPLCVATGTCDAAVDSGVPVDTGVPDAESLDASMIDAGSDAAVIVGEAPVFTKPVSTAQDKPNNLLRLEWNAPQTTPNGKTITGYNVLWSDGVNPSESRIIPNPDFKNMGIRITTPNANYSVYIQAVYDGGASYSDWSNPVNFSTDNSCITLLTMDEGAGNRIFDSIGTNDGTLVGFDPANNYAAAWAQGISGTAAVFDGIGTYIDMGDTFNFDSTDPFTIDAWVRRGSVGSYQTVFSKVDYSDPTQMFKGPWFGYTDTGSLRFHLYSDWSSLNFLVMASTTQFNTPNEQHSIVLTYDGNSLASGVMIYANGSIQPTTIYYDSLSGTTLNNIPSRIGAAIADGGPVQNTFQEFDGVIDDLAIYIRVLTPGEILNNTCARVALQREENNDPSPLPVECD